MMREEIEYILKRMPYIKRGLRERRENITFYVGNRKEEIIFTSAITVIVNILQQLLQSESPMIVKIIRWDIEQGWSDQRIIMNLPLSATAYYRLKKNIYNKIYDCCIACGLVTYEEILAKEIV